MEPAPGGLDQEKEEEEVLAADGDEIRGTDREQDQQVIAFVLPAGRKCHISRVSPVFLSSVPAAVRKW
jgi:lipid A disaccharide synthetase